LATHRATYAEINSSEQIQLLRREADEMTNDPEVRSITFQAQQDELTARRPQPCQSGGSLRKEIAGVKRVYAAMKHKCVPIETRSALFSEECRIRAR
jgi:hypothetical protein